MKERREPPGCPAPQRVRQDANSKGDWQGQCLQAQVIGKIDGNHERVEKPLEKETVTLAADIIGLR
jgi:hypothetical protein